MRWECTRERERDSLAALLSLQALKNAALYVLLAPFDHEQSDLLHRVAQEKKLQYLPIYKYDPVSVLRTQIEFHVHLYFREVLECFKRNELLVWVEFQARFAPSLREGASDGPAPGVFGSDEVGERQWEDFRKRVVEHVSTAVK